MRSFGTFAAVSSSDQTGVRVPFPQHQKRRSGQRGFPTVSNWSLKSILSEIGYRLRHGGDFWRIITDDTGIGVENNGRQIESIEWQSVPSVVGYKIDRLTYAPIRISFNKDKDPSLVVEELVDGFEALATQLEARFPGMLRDWRTKLEEGGAFDRNVVTIWTKQ